MQQTVDADVDVKEVTIQFFGSSYYYAAVVMATTDAAVPSVVEITTAVSLFSYYCSAATVTASVANIL